MDSILSVSVFIMHACLQALLAMIGYVMQGLMRVLLQKVEIVVPLTNKSLNPHVA